jgi:hypothetical protein
MLALEFQLPREEVLRNTLSKFGNSEYEYSDVLVDESVSVLAQLPRNQEHRRQRRLRHFTDCH